MQDGGLLTTKKELAAQYRMAAVAVYGIQET
jgi:hypothetical protein